MEIIKKATDSLKMLTEAALALLSLAVVVQILVGPGAPFVPGDVVGNVIDVTRQLGGEGVVGLVAIWVLVHIFNRKQ